MVKLTPPSLKEVTVSLFYVYGSMGKEIQLANFTKCWLQQQFFYIK